MAATFYNGEYLRAVVAEFGSYSTKIGWAGEDIPRAYFRSVRFLFLPLGGTRRYTKQYNEDTFVEKLKTIPFCYG
jgi:actin-related protein